MNYENFKKELAQEIRRKAPKGMEVSFCSIPKNNGIVLDAVTIWNRECVLAPAVYLEGCYQEYCDGKELTDLAVEVLEMGSAGTLKDFQTDSFLQWETAKEHIYRKVIHYRKNRKLLNQVPHIRVLDLAIVCYYQVPESQLEEAAILIHNSHRENWEISEGELFETAKCNDRHGRPAKFLEMDQLIRSMMNDSERSVFEQELQERRLTPVPMYVLTNQKRQLGAVCIFYERMTEILAEYLNSDFFVLPSSIHECIIVPDSGMFSKEELREMVCEVNRTQVEPQEVLSDHVYHYSRKKQILSCE